MSKGHVLNTGWAIVRLDKDGKLEGHFESPYTYSVALYLTEPIAQRLMIYHGLSKTHKAIRVNIVLEEVDSE